MLEHQLASFKMQYNSSIVILSRKIDDKTADKPENENTNVLELIDKLQNNNVDEKDDVLAQLQKKQMSIIINLTFLELSVYMILYFKHRLKRSEFI